jgi:23S rRNA (guanosine2251-2'-O)-methyltransferase
MVKFSKIRQFFGSSRIIADSSLVLSLARFYRTYREMEKNEQNIVFGRHPVLDALQVGVTVEKLILQEGLRGDFEKEIRRLSKERDIPLQVAPKERLNRLAGGNHQGIVGFISLIPYYRLEDVLPLVYERSQTPLLLALDGVTDVRNFGAIARSAECAGAQALVIPRKGAARVNAEAMKASAGALARIPVCRERSLASAIEQMKLAGLQIAAGSLKAEKWLFEVDLRGPIALLLGAEGEGLSREAMRLADHRFAIPQRGEGDSFNVSVAAGIMVYEVMRQRWPAG